MVQVYPRDSRRLRYNKSEGVILVTVPLNRRWLTNLNGEPWPVRKQFDTIVGNVAY